MAIRVEELKRERIEALAARIGDRIAADKAPPIREFVRQFYAHVPPDDILDRPIDDLYGAALSLWHFAQARLPGRAKLRAFNPRPAEQGWHSSRTVVEIINDDMPFLVDSVTAALNGLGIIVHLVIHPILRVRRDAAGRLAALLPPGPVAREMAGEALRESAMHVEISEQSDPRRLAEIAAQLEAVLTDVRAAVEDWRPMRARLRAVAESLAAAPPPLPTEEVAEGVDFLRWLDEDNFTFLGFREYRFGAVPEAAPEAAKPDAGSDPGSDPGSDIVTAEGLGILRDPAYPVFEGLRHFASLPGEVQDFLRLPQLLIVTKSNHRSTVHRPVQMDAIGIKIFAASGEVVGARMLVGLFTSLAYSRSPRSIPLLRRKVAHAIERSGFTAGSHDGKALLHILESFPRDELFQISEDELYETAIGILNLQERQRIALFVRRDYFGRFASCFVYVPRDRYDTGLRERFARILEKALDGTVGAAFTHLDESVLARIHFVIKTTPGRKPELDIAAIERRLAEAGRSWPDRLGVALVEAHGEEAGLALLARYGEAFPTAYRERFAASAALYDIDRLEAVRQGTPLAMTLYRPVEAEPAELRFKIYHAGAPVPLSDILPMLEHMGLKVIGEVPYEILPAGGNGVAGDGAVWMQDFSLLVPGAAEIDIGRDRQRFEEAFARIWDGAMENDGFNRLILAAELGWRQVVVLRLYCKVLRQAGTAFSQAYMEDTLARHPGIAAALVRLFERRFDPARQDGRDAPVDVEVEAAAAAIERDLDGVTNLDEDRILGSFLLLIRRSLRTNHFQRGADGAPKPYLAVKLASHDIELLPLPRPLCEIFVYSPRVEAVHLRGGKVARGGIRWSDRKEDFRTEILGLMKAQMVKNAVIVPVGSKGGFVVKRPPPLRGSQGREALMAEVVACYQTLMRGLLDLTDNIVGDRIVPPPAVVRLDGDDPYLVVAADKGTATFSDIANGVAAEYGFWLGDAFASGGSAGYDHKAMGITARGAWELIKRHFRELGRDIQTSDFTVVGVGDMSGDVFGNGMLLSRHIKLIAAFNHQHIFLDPDPDPAAAWAERQRLFDLPRSSWADYDASLISPGGGVFERSAKSITPSPEIRALLKLGPARLTPAELIQTLLRAEIDLLWFGGIGTYVKAAAESHAEVGDRANDALRIDGREIRARVVGEGANLAATQRGRIEYALSGGRINTDAIDNSAGVDTSDHEVNIKVLLNAVVAAGDMTMKQRDRLLHGMTDEVGRLVLQDNYLQGLALTLAEAQAADRLDQQARLIRELERAGKLDRTVEFLPDDQALAARAAGRLGLTRPELAVLMAYVKNTLKHELLATDLPDDPGLVRDLLDYFPRPLIERFRPAIEAHRLRRELVATVAANDLVNRGGIVFVSDMMQKTGRGPADVARAYLITRGIFDLDALWTQIQALDNRAPAALQTEMLLATGRLCDHVTAWLLHSGGALDIAARIAAFRPGVQALVEALPEILPEGTRQAWAARAAELAGRGAPEDLARAVARLDLLTAALEIVRLGVAAERPVVELARIYYLIGTRLGLTGLRAAARGLKTETTWQKLAVSALIDDLYTHHVRLTAKAAAEAGSAALDPWIAAHGGEFGRFAALVQEIQSSPALDLAMLTVANRHLGALAG